MRPPASPPPPAPAARVVAVACSGGRDSTALLHATASAARALGLSVVALHVHHGLNPQADGWLDHLQAQVAQWAAQGLPVRLAWERLAGAPGRGDSVEAWARAGRHEALQRMAQQAGADLLLLAHHQRDQAETFLLQALRGGGVAGLAAMPARQWRGGVCWARPWLAQPREAVQAYVERHALLHIEDDSNAQLRFARNRLRQTVWPALLGAAPAAEASLAQSAQWVQEALALQQEIAALDLATWAPQGPMQVGAWAALSPARLSALLRAWLQAQAGRPAPASLVARLLGEVPGMTVGRWPLGQSEVRLYRGELSVARIRQPAASQPEAPPQTRGLGAARIEDATLTSAAPLRMDLSRPGIHRVPQWGGAFEVVAADGSSLGGGSGVPASRLSNVELRPREGGRQFQAHAHGIPRSLKKCWQSAGIPVPQREGPLLYDGDALLFVPGLGLDARVLKAAGEGLFTVHWHPDAC